MLAGVRKDAGSAGRVLRDGVAALDGGAFDEPLAKRNAGGLAPEPLRVVAARLGRLSGRRARRSAARLERGLTQRSGKRRHTWLPETLRDVLAGEKEPRVGGGEPRGPPPPSEPRRRPSPPELPSWLPAERLQSRHEPPCLCPRAVEIGPVNH